MRGKLILLYQPDAKFREELMRYLEDAGFQVAAAPSEEAIVRMALRLRPMVLVSHLRGIGHDSFIVCRDMKRDIGTRHISIIFLTPQEDEMQRIVALELGADDCLARPVNLRELVLRIKRALQRQSPGLPAKRMKPRPPK